MTSPTFLIVNEHYSLLCRTAFPQVSRNFGKEFIDALTYFPCVKSDKRCANLK